MKYNIYSGVRRRYQQYNYICIKANYSLTAEISMCFEQCTTDWKRYNYMN